jgi:MOSC domain-containing protein YiiM
MAADPGTCQDEEMSTPRVVSVNVGRPVIREWSDTGRSAIAKQPVSAPVVVTNLGLDADQVSDTQHHGGLDQAVYAFAREDLDRWAELLGEPVPDGQFGENLTTGGIDVNEAEVGERWRIGSAVFEVASPRIPCVNFKAWMHACGYDDRGWVRRFTAEARPGPYLRVVEEGLVQAGDPLEVLERPGHGVTLTTMFRALTTDRTLLPTLLPVRTLPAGVRRRAEEYVAQQR